MPEVSVIDWHVVPFKRDAFVAGWLPACERARAYGATSWSLTRSEDDPLAIRQTTVWNDRADFQRYWTSDEISAIRAELLSHFGKPVTPSWHALLGDG
jgi:quinol monooxygenase YgiN